MNVEKELLWQAYVAGFNRSAEGWNGEWCSDPKEKQQEILRHGFPGDNGFEGWYEQVVQEGVDE